MYDLFASWDLYLYEDKSWFFLLRQYSGLSLTYASDRLTALQGIVSELQKTRKDDFRYGVWEDGLAEQLCWGPVHWTEDDEPSLPSWSWAKSSGYKEWETAYFPGCGIDSLPRAINISDSGRLRVTEGAIDANTYTSNGCTRCITDLTLERYRHGHEGCKLPRWILGTPSHYLLVDRSTKQYTLGFVIYDHYVPVENAVCFVLAKAYPLSQDHKYVFALREFRPED